MAFSHAEDARLPKGFGGNFAKEPVGFNRHVFAGHIFFIIWAAASDVGGYVAARVSASISGVPISIGWEVGLAHFGKLF